MTPEELERLADEAKGVSVWSWLRVDDLADGTVSFRPTHFDHVHTERSLAALDRLARKYATLLRAAKEMAYNHREMYSEIDVCGECTCEICSALREE